MSLVLQTTIKPIKRTSTFTALSPFKPFLFLKSKPFGFSVFIICSSFLFCLVILFGLGEVAQLLYNRCGGMAFYLLIDYCHIINNKRRCKIDFKIFILAVKKKHNKVCIYCVQMLIKNMGKIIRCFSVCVCVCVCVCVIGNLEYTCICV